MTKTKHPVCKIYKDFHRAMTRDSRGYKETRTYNFGCGIGQVSQGPETVLHKALASMTQVVGQGLHATYKTENIPHSYFYIY